MVLEEYGRPMNGEWQHVAESDAAERIVCLFETGRYAGISMINSRISAGAWAYDEATDVLTIRTNVCSDTVRKCVFRVEEGGAMLYFYDDMPSARPSVEEIVVRKAYVRYRIVRVG